MPATVSVAPRVQECSATPFATIVIYADVIDDVNTQSSYSQWGLTPQEGSSFSNRF